MQSSSPLATAPSRVSSGWSLRSQPAGKVFFVSTQAPRFAEAKHAPFGASGRLLCKTNWDAGRFRDRMVQQARRIRQGSWRNRCLRQVGANRRSRESTPQPRKRTGAFGVPRGSCVKAPCVQRSRRTATTSPQSAMDAVALAVTADMADQQLEVQCRSTQETGTLTAYSLCADVAV